MRFPTPQSRWERHCTGASRHLVIPLAEVRGRGAHLARPLAHHERLRQQQRLARRPRARFASAAFVSGGLDCATDPHWRRRQSHVLQCPLHVVVASEAPSRSRGSMEQLAQEADQVTFIPGRLGLHQEFGALLARTLLAGSVEVRQGHTAPAPE